MESKVCVFCGRPVDEDDDTALEYVERWEAVDTHEPMPGTQRAIGGVAHERCVLEAEAQR